jgi:thioredoxin 2
MNRAEEGCAAQFEPEGGRFASNSGTTLHQERPAMPILQTCKHCGTKNRTPAAHLADTGRCGSCKAELPPLRDPLAADAAIFDDVIQNARVPVLVDFWAEWCGPCKRAAPYVSQTAAAMAGKAVVLKVDTEANPQLAARYNVRGIPNFAVFAGGKLVQQQAGLVDSRQMQAWIEAAAAATN